MKTIFLPFLHDSHNHISFYSSLSGAADLSGCETLGQAMSVLNGRRKESFIFATGWKDNYYSLTPELLADLPPAAVCNISLHGFCFNAAALNSLERKHPGTGARLRSQKWIDLNLPLVFSLLADYGEVSFIPEYIKGLERKGVWSSEDMSVSSEKACLYISDNYRDRVKIWAGLGVYPELGKARGRVSGIKLFADGALGARSAGLSGKCSAGSRDCVLYSDEEMLINMRRAAGMRKNIAVHAIGDAAVEQVVSCAEKIKSGGTPMSLRLEHVQFINLGQALRAKKLGAVLCMQPNFSPDSVFYSDRLPDHYVKGNNPFRMLIDRAGFICGRDLVFGSDGMPAGACEAIRSSLFPPFESQRLSLEEFKAGYCVKDGSRVFKAEIDEENRSVSVSVPEL